MMKVSILVPVYGVEKYIEKCAVSLFEQSYEDIEYIFVNDCTPDRSIEVLRGTIARYPQRQKQVVIIDHDVNRGLGAARHTATEAATGELVMHVDSDDYLMPHAVEHLCAKMEETGADIVDGGYVTVTADRESALIPPFHGTKEKYLKLMLCQNIVFNRIWGRIYRRALFTEGGINSVEGINYGEDYVVVPRLILGAKRACLGRVRLPRRQRHLLHPQHQREAQPLALQGARHSQRILHPARHPWHLSHRHANGNARHGAPRTPLRRPLPQPRRPLPHRGERLRSKTVQRHTPLPPHPFLPRQLPLPHPPPPLLLHPLTHP